MSEPFEDDGPPQDTRPMSEILDPPASKGRLRDLPLLVARSLQLVSPATAASPRSCRSSLRSSR